MFVCFYIWGFKNCCKVIVVDLGFSEVSVIKLHKLYSCVTLKIQITQFLVVFGLFFLFFFPERLDFIIINRKIFHVKSLAGRIVITKPHTMVKKKFLNIFVKQSLASELYSILIQACTKGKRKRLCKEFIFNFFFFAFHSQYFDFFETFIF